METLIVGYTVVKLLCNMLHKVRSGEVPVVFVTGVTLVTFKTLTFLFYNTLFGLLVLLSLPVVFLVVSDTIKSCL